MRADGRKVVVLDDDPTGTQTVADIPVLTTWTVAALSRELSSAGPAFYILTNTRGLPEAEAVALTREIGQNLVSAGRNTGRDFVVVSRGDSTLRGHFPAEVDALAAALGRRYDGLLLIPFFEEGGRITHRDIHYVREGADLVPAAATPFAQDKTFGYTSSNLREWVLEKTNGRIAPDDIKSISIEDIRQGGPDRVRQILQDVAKEQVVIVNAVATCDLEVVTDGLLAAEASGKRFLYRTAASFVQVRAGLAPPPLLTPADLDLPATGGGLIVVGSYVPKTTQQIEALRAGSAVRAAEVQVGALLNDATRPAEIARVIRLANDALDADLDFVAYTSRRLAGSDSDLASLAAGQQISASLVRITRGVAVKPRYILAKGGITASDIATKALEVDRAIVAGQILPGVPVWRLGAESRYPDLTYIVFPGNVGETGALAQLVNQLAQSRSKNAI